MMKGAFKFMAPSSPAGATEYTVEFEQTGTGWNWKCTDHFGFVHSMEQIPAAVEKAFAPRPTTVQLETTPEYIARTAEERRDKQWAETLTACLAADCKFPPKISRPENLEGLRLRIVDQVMKNLTPPVPTESNFHDPDVDQVKFLDGLRKGVEDNMLKNVVEENERLQQRVTQLQTALEQELERNKSLGEELMRARKTAEELNLKMLRYIQEAEKYCAERDKALAEVRSYGEVIGRLRKAVREVAAL